MAEVINLGGEQAKSRAHAKEILAGRFVDVRDEPATGGWSAMCPLCDSETRIRISRDYVVETCPNGHEPGAIMEATAPAPDVSDSLERVRSLEGATLDEIEDLDIAPPEWIVEGFIEEGSFGVIFGPPGAGKTLLAIRLLCLAAAHKLKVKFFEAEGGLFYLRKRLLRAAGAIDGVNKKLINLSWCAPLDISTQGGTDQLVDHIRGYDLAILDSMAALSGGVSENDDDWSRVSNNLAWARSRSDCAVLGLHHPTKTLWKPGETPELRHLRGHGALAGRADFAYGIVPGPEEDGQVVFDLHDLKEREAGKPKPRRCKVDMISTAAHFSMEDISPSTKARRSEAAFLAEIEAIIPIACDHKNRKCISKTKIENIVPGRHEPVRRAIDQLEHSNRIVALRLGCYVKTPPGAGLGGVGRAIPPHPAPPFRVGGRGGAGGADPGRGTEIADPEPTP